MGLVGAHISTSGGLWRVFPRGESIGCEAVQLFTKNQIQWFASPLSWNEIYLFERSWRDSSIGPVVAHASYLINLASPDEPLRLKSVRAMVEELMRCHQLGIDSIVVHPGSHRGAGEALGLRLAARSLEEVLSRTEELKVRVLLETTAGQGSQLGYRLEQIRDVISMVERDDSRRRLGVCLDTAHLFAAGYDLDAEGGYERLIWNAERLFGLEAVGCVHLNDSDRPRGSRMDRHAHIGQGQMGLTPFRAFLNDPRLEEVPMVIETPKEDDWDRKNIFLLKKLRGF